MKVNQEINGEVSNYYRLLRKFRDLSKGTPNLIMLTLLENSYKKLKITSYRNDIHYDFCPVEVYKETFPKRFWAFEEVYKSSDIKDFIENEMILPTTPLHIFHILFSFVIFIYKVVLLVNHIIFI